MFTNLLYFIIVFALFSFSEPMASTSLTPYEILAGMAAGYGIFYLLLRGWFARLERAVAAGECASFSSRHAGLISRGMVLSVFFYAFFIYGLDCKAALVALPVAASSDLVQSFAAVALFFAFLLIIWVSAYGPYKRYFNASASLAGYVGSHIRFNSAIVAPWLIFSFVLDAVSLLPRDFTAAIAANPVAGYGLPVVLFLVLGVFFPALLVRLWACKPLAPGPVRERIEDFCRRAGFSYADILEWNLFGGKLITAGVLGFVARFRYLLISPALLDLLDSQELEAVVAHEIGHVKRHHMAFYLVFILGYTFFAYIFFSIILYGLLSNAFLFDLIIRPDGKPGPGISFVSMLILVAVLLVYFRLLFGLFSRNFERQADAFACRYTGSASGIIQSLEKIALASAQSRSAPNWHHYSIQQRVDFMHRCSLDPRLVRQHDRKVLRLIVAYCAAFLMLGAAYAGFGKYLVGDSELAVLQNIVQQRLDAQPDNPQLHFLLGNIYYEKKEYGPAIDAYSAALRLAPDNAEALNNLAWLYATVPDQHWRNPSEALRLSQRAAELDPKPYILDTLAESYFVNGDYEEALDAIELAIMQNPPNLPYYESQREKFRQHLDAEQRGHTGDDEDTDHVGISI